MFPREESDVSGSHTGEGHSCPARKDGLPSVVLSKAMYLIGVETPSLRCLSVRSRVASRPPKMGKAIHRHLISSWCCTPGNCSGHYALCLMVGLVELRVMMAMTRGAVVVYGRGLKNSKRKGPITIVMCHCTASHNSRYAIHEGRSQVRMVWQADVVCRSTAPEAVQSKLKRASALAAPALVPQLQTLHPLPPFAP